MENNKAFKRDLQEDIDEAFLDLDAFAEEQELAGKTVSVVSEYLEVDPPADAEPRPGVRYEGVTLYVSLLDMPDEFLPGKRTTWKGEPWWILDADRELLRAIHLYRERS